MKRVALFVVLVLTTASTQSQKHGWDTTVCSQLPTSQNDISHKRPYLPKTFGIRVEANILDQNYTTDVEEWYDEPNNRGAIEEYVNGAKMIGIYDYDLNELIVVTPKLNSDFDCTVSDLSTDPNRFLFGTKTYANGTDRMYSAAGALRFGGSVPEKYLGVQEVRGIQCDAWQSCIYWPDMDATMQVQWYFSRPDWLTSEEIAQVPVRCHVTGKIWNGSSSRNFEHIYEMSEFRNNIDGETKRFETPQGAYCRGMKTRTKPPVPAKAFSFGAEVQVPEMNKITYMRESYDHSARLVKLEYKPSNFGGYGATVDRTTEIHDFNTGLAYVMDEVHNNCTVNLISASGFDAQTTGGLYVRMRSSSEFFFTNHTSFIEYEGIRTVRGIECDVWIANKNDWPVGNPLNSTWEWYFARKEWQSNAGYSFESQMPVGIIITLHMDPAEHFYYSIYDYDETSGNIWNYDVSSCYNTKHKHYFQMLLKGNFTEDVLSDEMFFKSFVVTSLVVTMGVSPLRIADLDVDHNNQYIKVTFNLLDTAPFPGNIPNFPTQTPMATAVQRLNQALAKNTLVIPVAVGSLNNILNLTAIPFSDKLWGFKMMTMAALVTSQPDEEAEVAQDVPEQEADHIDVDPALGEIVEEPQQTAELPSHGAKPELRETDDYPMDEEFVAEYEHQLYKRSVMKAGLELSAVELCQQPVSVGYTGGQLAGIAIGMLVLGFLACFGAIIIGSKYGNRAIRNQGYEMT